MNIFICISVFTAAVSLVCKWFIKQFEHFPFNAQTSCGICAHSYNVTSAADTCSCDLWSCWSDTKCNEMSCSVEAFSVLAEVK